MTRGFTIATDDGLFTAWFSEQGLVALDFPSRNSRPESATGADAAELRNWPQLTAAALRSALAGKNPVSLPPLDWRGATAFQQAIWRAMQRVPPGRTRTYAQLAAAAGRPRAVRAAGGACGANPIPVLVPCHRVVAAGGRLGGFSGGLDWKRLLLGRENALPET